MKSLLQYFYIPMFAIVGKENGQLDYRWIQIPNGLDHRGKPLHPREVTSTSWDCRGSIEGDSLLLKESVRMQSY
jgi:hypothetical protein